MSRIGNNPILIPDNVQVNIENNKVTVKGPKGEISKIFSKDISISLDDKIINVKRSSEDKEFRSLHGLTRALLNNMVVGTSVGYRASNSGQKLEMSLCYSNNVVFQIPDEVKVETKSEKGQNPLVILTSHDNQLLGLVAAKIRSLRKPEPYKGKGIKFVGEQLRRKAGKTAAS